MGASWRVFDDIVRKFKVPLDSEYNAGLLWRVRRAMSWDCAVDRRRMVRLQLYALSIMLAEVAAGELTPAAPLLSLPPAIISRPGFLFVAIPSFVPSLPSRTATCARLAVWTCITPMTSRLSMCVPCSVYVRA